MCDELNEMDELVRRQAEEDYFYRTRCQHPGCREQGQEIEVWDGGESQIVFYCEWHCFEHGICRACLQQISQVDRTCGCIVDDECYDERDSWEQDLIDRRENDLDLPGCLFPGNCHMPGMHYKHECRSIEECEAFYDEMDCRDYPV